MLHSIQCLQILAFYRKPAIVYGEIVLPAFIYYFGKQSKIVAALLIRWNPYETMKPITIICSLLKSSLRLHEAAYYSGSLDIGAKYLEQAFNIYKIIPGESHPLISVDIARFQT